MGINEAKALTSAEAMLEATKVHSYNKIVPVSYDLKTVTPTFYRADDAAEVPGQLRCVAAGNDFPVEDVITSKELEFLEEIMGRILVAVKP